MQNNFWELQVETGATTLWKSCETPKTTEHENYEEGEKKLTSQCTILRNSQMLPSSNHNVFV